MSNRTKGEWVSQGAWVMCNARVVASAVVQNSDTGKQVENAQFIALAGTVAHKLDSLGYDGERTIEAIPDIINLLALLVLQAQTTDCDDAWAEVSPSEIATASALIESLKPLDNEKTV